MADFTIPSPSDTAFWAGFTNPQIGIFEGGQKVFSKTQRMTSQALSSQNLEENSIGRIFQDLVKEGVPTEHAVELAKTQFKAMTDAAQAEQAPLSPRYGGMKALEQQAAQTMRSARRTGLMSNVTAAPGAKIDIPASATGVPPKAGPSDEASTAALWRFMAGPSRDAVTIQSPRPQAFDAAALTVRSRAQDTTRRPAHEMNESPQDYNVRLAEYKSRKAVESLSPLRRMEAEKRNLINPLAAQVKLSTVEIRDATEKLNAIAAGESGEPLTEREWTGLAPALRTTQAGRDMLSKRDQQRQAFQEEVVSKQSDWTDFDDISRTIGELAQKYPTISTTDKAQVMDALNKDQGLQGRLRQSNAAALKSEAAGKAGLTARRLTHALANNLVPQDPLLKKALAEGDIPTILEYGDKYPADSGSLTFDAKGQASIIPEHGDKEAQRSRRDRQAVNVAVFGAAPSTPEDEADILARMGGVADRSDANAKWHPEDYRAGLHEDLGELPEHRLESAPEVTPSQMTTAVDTVLGIVASDQIGDVPAIRRVAAAMPGFSESSKLVFEHSLADALASRRVKRADDALRAYRDGPVRDLLASSLQSVRNTVDALTATNPGDNAELGKLITEQFGSVGNYVSAIIPESDAYSADLIGHVVSAMEVGGSEGVQALAELQNNPLAQVYSDVYTTVRRAYTQSMAKYQEEVDGTNSRVRGINDGIVGVQNARGNTLYEQGARGALLDPSKPGVEDNVVSIPAGSAIEAVMSTPSGKATYFVQGPDGKSYAGDISQAILDRLHSTNPEIRSRASAVLSREVTGWTIRADKLATMFDVAPTAFGEWSIVAKDKTLTPMRFTTSNETVRQTTSNIYAEASPGEVEQKVIDDPEGELPRLYGKDWYNAFSEQLAKASPQVAATGMDKMTGAELAAPFSGRLKTAILNNPIFQTYLRSDNPRDRLLGAGLAMIAFETEAKRTIDTTLDSFLRRMSVEARYSMGIEDSGDPSSNLIEARNSDRATVDDIKRWAQGRSEAMKQGGPMVTQNVITGIGVMRGWLTPANEMKQSLSKEFGTVADRDIPPMLKEIEDVFKGLEDEAQRIAAEPAMDFSYTFPLVLAKDREFPPKRDT